MQPTILLDFFRNSLELLKLPFWACMWLCSFFYYFIPLQAEQWSAPIHISISGQNASKPQIAVDPFGNAIAVWHRFDGRHSIVQAITYSIGSGLQFVSTSPITGIPSLFASATAKCSLLGSTTMTNPGGLRIARTPDKFLSNLI